MNDHSTTSKTEEIARRNAGLYNYHEHGFVSSPGPILDPDTIAEIADHAERVLQGEYETGIAPRSNTGGSDLGSHPAYIESQMPQDADNVIARAIRDPRIGTWAAKVCGAKRLKVWGALVMKKYPRSDVKSVVGWHQDRRYLDTIVNGQSLNCWIALNEVSPDVGPIRFIPKSNLWNQKYQTGFFEHDVDKQKGQLSVPEGEVWEEVECALPSGWATIHNKDTLHGSGMNRGTRPRLSMLINIGVDDFTMVPGHYFESRYDDPRATPVLWPLEQHDS
jgi:hypothetical protein